MKFAFGQFLSSRALNDEFDAEESDLTGALTSALTSGTKQTHFAQAKIGALGWLEANIPGTESAIAGGGLASLSPVGASGAVFGSRSVDSNNPGGMSFAMGAFSLNNNPNSVQTTYAGYFEARRSSGSGTTQGIEIGVVNSGAEIDANPWSMGATGSTLALWLSGGRPDAPGNRATLALGVINNGAPFMKGIVVAHDALLIGPAGGEALCLATGHGVMWHGTGDYGVTSCIRSDTNAASTTGLRAVIFTDTGAVIRTPDGVNSLDVSSGLIQTTNLRVNLGFTVQGASVFNGGATFAQPVTMTGRLNIGPGGVFGGLPGCADDAAAATRGIVVGQWYIRTSTGAITARLA